MLVGIQEEMLLLPDHELFPFLAATVLFLLVFLRVDDVRDDLRRTHSFLFLNLLILLS